MSAFGLAACSSDGGSSSSGSDEPVTIEYMHRLPDGEGMTPVSEIVDRWNEENPDVQVKATKFDGKPQDMILKLETDLKAGNAPCLAQVGYGEVPQLFVKGLLEDVAGEAEKYADNFSSGAYAGMQVGDAVVGLPQDTGPLVYFYNETAFTPDEAQNWLAAQSAAAGDAWFAADGDEWVVDTQGEGTEKVAAFWQDLLDNDETLVTERWGEGFDKALVDGSLIGHVGAAWEAGFLLDSLDGTDAEGQWRVAQLPDYGAGQLTGPDGGSGVAVLKDCDAPEQAMEFNNWFNTQIDDLGSQGLGVAATTGTPKTSEKMEKQFGGQDVLAELGTATENLNPDFVYAPGFSTLAKMNEVAADAGSGSAKVSDIFETAQTTMVSALEDLGLPVAK